MGTGSRRWQWRSMAGGDGDAGRAGCPLLPWPRARARLAKRACSKDYKKSHLEHLTVTGTGTLRNTPCHEKQSRIYHETSQHYYRNNL